MPRLQHHDIQERQVESVGEWLLQREEFRSWYAGSGGNEFDDAVCCAMHIRGSTGLISGKWDRPRGMEGGGQVLTRRDVSDGMIILVAERCGIKSVKGALI